MTWYNPKDASKAFDEGWYPATIESTEMGKTKKGAPMQTVIFKVYGGKRTISVREFFHPASTWKYKGLARALGEGDNFDEGNFDAAKHRGKAVEIYLKVEESAEYGEQNRPFSFAADGENTSGVSGARVSAPAEQTSSVGGHADTEIDHSDIPF